MESPIRNTIEYQRGYSDGYKEGYSKALLDMNLEKLTVCKPVTIQCTPRDGNCPVVANEITQSA